MAGTTNAQQWNPAAINQESDAAYTADSNREGGFGTDAIVPSPTLNKFMYNVSTYVAALGQMLANKGFTNSDASLSVLTAVMSNILTSADVLPNLVGVGFSPTPAFNAGVANGFEIPLNGNITASTIAGLSAGQLLTFVFTQDAIGGRTVAWPASFVGTIQPDPAANAVSVMMYRVDLAGIPRAVTPMFSNNGAFFGAVSIQSLIFSGTSVGAVLIGNGAAFAPRVLTQTNPAGRLFGVAYQNTSGAEMKLSVVGYSSAAPGTNSFIQLVVGPTSGSMSQVDANGIANGPGYGGVQATIPAGSWYQVNVLSGPMVENSWVEFIYV